MKRKKNTAAEKMPVIMLFMLVFLILTAGEKETNRATSPVVCNLNLSLQETKPVSNLLMGFNTVYAWEADSLWNDGKFENYLKEVCTRILRYPGGTVSSYYHWNALTGEGWKDSWDPSNRVTPREKSEFMDLNEFISLAGKLKITPLLGINMSSGRRWNRTEEGIQEALSLMKYCRDRHFDVRYWYLDNEPYQKDSNGGSKTAEEYANLVKQYAYRMKEFDPAIKIIVNWQSALSSKTGDYRKILEISGDLIDMVDVHWYWNWNNPTFGKWLGKTPTETWTGKSYIDEIAGFRSMVKEAGHPGIGLASLEWNVGPVRNKQLTPHQCAFIQSEMLMQFISGGLDMATFWPIHGSGDASAARSFVNKKEQTANPVYHTFAFLGKFQGGKPIKCLRENIVPGIFAVGALDDQGNTRLCILNKRDSITRINLNSSLFRKAKLTEKRVFVLSGDGSGSKTGPAGKVTMKKTGISFLSQGVSITMLTFKQQQVHK